jgi:hypothetical protein
MSVGENNTSGAMIPATGSRGRVTWASDTVQKNTSCIHPGCDGTPQLEHRHWRAIGGSSETIRAISGLGTGNRGPRRD